MDCEQSKVIFVAQDAHVFVAALGQLRTRKQIVDGSIRELKSSGVKINQAIAEVVSGGNARGRQILLRPDKQIDIAIRPQAWLWIQTRDGPALNQNRFDPCRAQRPEDSLNPGFVNAGLQREKAKGLMKQLTGGCLG